MPASDPLQILPATSDDLAEVFSFVFSKNEPQDALNRVRAALAEHRCGKLPLAGLLAARRGGQLVGAVFLQVLPGRMATLWPPRISVEEPEETADRLATEAIGQAKITGARVVHALLEGRADPCDVAVLDRAGFVRLAELYYLVADVQDFPASDPSEPLTFEPCTPEKLERLSAVVEATYRETLDCPDLDGVRSAEEVLRGYGGHDSQCPPHWFFVRHQDCDVGCLLLSDYPEHGNCELTYMGLTPSSRGSGWGYLVTRYAQWITKSLGRDRIVLAVDAVNQPARNMYAAAGFRGWDRRQVFMLVLEAHTTGPDTGELRGSELD